MILEQRKMTVRVRIESDIMIIADDQHYCEVRRRNGPANRLLTI